MKKIAFTPIIGMEIHVELRTLSKMFCGCPAYHFGQHPNTQTCPVCLGLPGALPVPNRKAIDWTILIGLALQCRINSVSKFDRKHYFYPDLAKGYQISQYDDPFCVQGIVKTSRGDVRITRVHLEEDTGKLQHKMVNGEKVSLVDFNRSGVPLVEIVTEPDITSSSHAKEYAQKVRQLVSFLGVSDADMEKGSMRLEANISLGLSLGYKVEVKNINSFRFLEKAIDFELNRQRLLLEQGITPDQETRGFNEAAGVTLSQRSKEGAADYRYFPDPDIPPIHLSTETIDILRSSMPKLPDDYRQLFVNTYRIRPDYANSLTEFPKLAQKAADAFNLGLEAKIRPELIANYLINKKSQAETQSAQEVIDTLKSQPKSGQLGQNELQVMVDAVVASNPDVVAKYRAGKESVIGVLIGQVMMESRGQADPKQVHLLLTQKVR